MQMHLGDKQHSSPNSTPARIYPPAAHESRQLSTVMLGEATATRCFNVRADVLSLWSASGKGYVSNQLLLTPGTQWISIPCTRGLWWGPNTVFKDRERHHRLTYRQSESQMSQCTEYRRKSGCKHLDNSFLRIT